MKKGKAQYERDDIQESEEAGNPNTKKARIPPSLLRYDRLMQDCLGPAQGELLRLKWSDVDWNAGILTIRETKAGDSRRIPMNSTVQNILSNMRKSSEVTPEDRIFLLDARYTSEELSIRRLLPQDWLPFGFMTCGISLPRDWGCRGPMTEP